MTTNTKETPQNSVEESIREADILISATGVMDPFDARLIKPGCSLIDVGFIWDEKNDSFRGDVNFMHAIERCKLLSLIPGGVGPVNAAMLVRNLVSNWAEICFGDSSENQH